MKNVFTVTLSYVFWDGTLLCQDFLVGGHETFLSSYPFYYACTNTKNISFLWQLAREFNEGVSLSKLQKYSLHWQNVNCSFNTFWLYKITLEINLMKNYVCEVGGLNAVQAFPERREV